MQTVAISLKRAMVSFALALPTSLAMVSVATAAPAAPVTSAERCIDESYVWSGTAHLDTETPSVATGLEISSEVGARIDVVGVSADGLDASGHALPLSVTIGGVPAVAGGSVLGGAIEVHAVDEAVRDVTGATVAVRRCVVVAALGQTESGVSASPPQLPATGVDPRVFAAAVAATVGGLGLRRSARRRVVAVS
jgi:hypothetical protein